MNIQGKWTGVITYGKEYQKYAYKELYFEMEIYQDSNKINGKAFDTGGIGVNPDGATIEGTIINDEIKFVKQYPTFHYYHKGGTRIDKSRPGSKIDYIGNYNNKKDEFKGSWILHGKAKLFGIIAFKFINTGTWSMRRE